MSNACDILEDFAEIPEAAKVFDRSPRTIVRYCDQPDGLPYTKIGNKRLIHIPTAKEWLLARICKPNPTRRSRRAA